MRLITFNALRSIDISGVHYIKPDHYFHELTVIREADIVLYPEYWQVNSLVYALRKSIFPSVSSYHLGHDKIEQTRAFLSLVPNHVPLTEVLPSNDSSVQSVLERFDFPFVAKTVRSSMGEGVFLIESRQDFINYATQHEILYVQEYLPIQRDLRVVWVGKQVVTAYWREQTNGFHNNLARGGIIQFDAVPPAALELVTSVAIALGIDHAGFDVAVVAGHCYLLEFNVLFGLDGLQQQGIRLGNYVMRHLGIDDNKPTNPVRPRPLAA